MGWESNNVFQVLIITGSTGSGVFVYSPSPGPGNLVASIAAAVGTDPYGNAYKAGVASYSGTSFTNLNGGLINQGDGTSLGPAVISGSGGQLSLQSPIVQVFDAPAIVNLNAKGGNPSPTVIVANPALLQANGGAAVSNGLTVSGGETADTEVITSGRAAGLLLDITNTTTPASGALERMTVAGAGDTWLAARVSGDTNPRAQLGSTAAGLAQLLFGPGNAALDIILRRTTATQLSLLSASLDIATAGQGLQIKEGANARMGTAVLVAGTVTVNNTTITANTRVFLTAQVLGGTAGALRLGTVIAGTSFVINSNNAADTSTVAWLLVEPG